jgi:hypothetical protein
MPFYAVVRSHELLKQIPINNAQNSKKNVPKDNFGILLDNQHKCSSLMIERFFSLVHLIEMISHNVWS